jgi:hypothetical protein
MAFLLNLSILGSTLPLDCWFFLKYFPELTQKKLPFLGQQLPQVTHLDNWVVLFWIIHLHGYRVLHKTKLLLRYWHFHPLRLCMFDLLNYLLSWPAALFFLKILCNGLRIKLKAINLVGSEVAQWLIRLEGGHCILNYIVERLIEICLLTVVWRILLIKDWVCLGLARPSSASGHGLYMNLSVWITEHREKVVLDVLKALVTLWFHLIVSLKYVALELFA